MVNKENAEKYLQSSMAEMSLQIMAKNYAVNVMMLRRLSLLFAQQQKGSPLTDEEIKEVSDANQKLQEETENIAVADLHKKLELASDSAILAASEVKGKQAQ